MDFPLEFEHRIRQQMADADVFLNALRTDPVWSVRLHPRRNDHNLSLDAAVPWCEHGRYLTEKPLYTLNPFFHAGHFYPQEASSMFLWQALKQIEPLLPKEPRMLDLCAAPGGKSTLMASFLDGRGLLVSNEVIRSRAWILRENVVKWGYPQTMVTQNDPAAFGALKGFFDVMVVDAPCSGEGMFRKDAVAVREWSLANGELCAGRQRRILMDSWDALKTGGFLIYSTCTFSPAENEENMAWLAQQHEVEFFPLEQSPEWNLTMLSPAGYGFYPHRTKGEGFYLVVVRKRSGVANWSPRRSKQKTVVQAPTGLLNTNNMKMAEWNQQLVALPAEEAEAMEQVRSVCHVLHGGVVLGENSRKGFVPAAELPFSMAFSSDAYPLVEVDIMEALTYLKGQWSASVPEAQGWNVVVYRGARLGLIKVVGKRVNNYFPKEWRIRMNIDEVIHEY